MNPLELIKSVLPWIGNALGGPIGGIAASFVGDKLGLSGATVDTVKTILGGMSPEKLAEYKSLDNDFQIKMSSLGYDSIYKLTELEVRGLESVNKTMQVEATAEHWPSYSWRPFCGFVFGVTFFGNYFILPLCHIPVSPIPETAWLTIGAVLGVASYFRGKAQADPLVQNTSQVTVKG